jgi:hypothetical protein
MNIHTPIERLLFQPWMGQHYGSSSLFKIPVLIVGESNYGESRGSREQDAQFTHELIQNFMTCEWNLRFFNNIQRCFVETAHSPESRHEFWQSVAFYDYIQDWLPSHSLPPTEEMWTAAKPVFQTVVAQLQPRCILFVCKRLYYRVASQYPATILPVGTVEHPACQIESALASSIRHPSRNGFRNARPIVQALITAAGGQAML